ncbi:MAG TPA: hypothetical protein VJ746_16230 [Nitrospira sp.]|nr:hypothetical protein [Nitrospira sp.]
MNGPVMRGFLFAAGLALVGCNGTALSAGHSSRYAINKSAASTELKNETTTVAKLPEGCLATKPNLPPGRATMIVSYREPKVNYDDVPQRLGFTTIYLASDTMKPTAIRVWTNDSHGDSPVTIRDVAVPGLEFNLCVTATNWGLKESPPATLATESPASSAVKATR